MNHDELSTAELLATFNRAAGLNEAAPTGQPEATQATGADDEAPEAYEAAALATFERVAAKLRAEGIATRTPPAPVALAAAPAGRFGVGIVSDLANFERIAAEMDAATPAPVQPHLATLARLVQQARANPPAPAQPSKPAPLRELPAAVARRLASREARTRLPEATRAKLALTENRAMLAALQEHLAAKHGPNQTGPNGEPLGNWIAAAYVEQVAKIHTWESTTGKRLPDNVIPTHRAAQFTFHVIDRHLSRRAKGAARAAA